MSSGWAVQESSKGPTRDRLRNLYEFHTARKGTLRPKTAMNKAFADIRTGVIMAAIDAKTMETPLPCGDRLFGPAAEQERTIGAAETERIGHGVFEFRLACVVRNQVHPNRVGIGIFEINSGRDHLIA